METFSHSSLPVFFDVLCGFLACLSLAAEFRLFNVAPAAVKCLRVREWWNCSRFDLLTRESWSET
jgi:hypothetical protein